MTVSRRTATAAFAFLLALASACASAALPPGISGSWYNPAQAGHGLSVEILSPERALVFWYTYDPDGQPIFLYIDGRISGQRIDGVGYAPQGMQFGSFDPAALEFPEWGTVSLEFDSCNSGVLSWDSLLAEFPDGATPISRLTAIQDLGCEFAEPGGATKGLYSVAFLPAGPASATGGLAAVDGQGRLWAVGGLAEQSPGPSWLSASYACVALGEVNLPPSTLPSLLRESRNTWQLPAPWLPLLRACDERGWLGQATIIDGGFELPSADAPDASLWRFTPRIDATLVSPVSLADLEGRRSLRLRWQFGEVASILDVDADGGMCVERHNTVVDPPQPCGYRGRLVPDADDPGFVDVELSLGDALPFRGRGWLEETASGRRLVLIGSDGAAGMAIVAQ